MRKRSRKGKKQDINEIAKLIVDDATDETPEVKAEESPNDGKDPNAVALGRKGGLKGGKARWKGTTKKERSEAARELARKRWATKKDQA